MPKRQPRIQSFFMRTKKTLIRCADVQTDSSLHLGAYFKRYIFSHHGPYVVIQSTLVISKSTALSEILRYPYLYISDLQNWGKIYWTTTFHKRIIISLLTLAIYWKYCGKGELLLRGAISLLFYKGELLLRGAISLLFHKHNILLPVVKTGTRFSLRDKRLFEISEVEITRNDCISHHSDITYGPRKGREALCDCILLRRKKNSCVYANMLKKNWSVGRRNCFSFFYFLSRKELGRACNFMKIQVFCWGSVLHFFILHFYL